MPEVRGDDRHDCAAQRRLAESREHPQRNAQPGRNAETVKQRVVGGGLDPAIGQPWAIGEKVGRVKFDRGNHAQHRTDDQPERCAAKQREQRHAQEASISTGLPVFKSSFIVKIFEGRI